MMETQGQLRTFRCCCIEHLSIECESGRRPSRPVINSSTADGVWEQLGWKGLVRTGGVTGSGKEDRGVRVESQSADELSVNPPVAQF